MKLDQNTLNEYRNLFLGDTKNIVAMNAVTSNGIEKSARSILACMDTPHEFSIVIPQKGITDQKNSGRCWLFAATNCMRYQIMNKYNIEEFELSQNYLLFYDKLEKANYFLERMIDLVDEPLESRTAAYLLQEVEGDGGQWDMFCNIVRKYGIVPKYAMPETACSSKTEEMCHYLVGKLRQCASTLRSSHENGCNRGELHKLKTGMMADVYKLLCISLGTPPETFDLELPTKDHKYITDYAITPVQFYEKYCPLDVDEYVSLINATTADKPFNQTYTIKYLGNVEEGREIRYLNLTVDQLKRAALAQMKAGEPVWFGCDCGKFSSREDGMFCDDLYGVEALLGTDFSMTKAERLDYKESLMTHAMVFQGVNIGADGKPNRWRVENSWGEEAGKKGYYVMSDEWFSQYVYQVVVNRKFLTAAQLAMYEAEPVVLEPWDPMGSLAITK